MVNVLIADDNFLFAKKLMDYINFNQGVKVVQIALDGEEALRILSKREDIDIFLLDLKMPIYNGIEILEMLPDNKKKKYQNSCIVISGEMELVQKLAKNKIIYSIILKATDMSEIMGKIVELIGYKQKEKSNINLKNKIMDQLLYLGYNVSHIGTRYLMETIYYIIKHSNRKFDNLKRDIYPHVASRNHETPHNIKCNIARATNYMYYNCEIKKLQNYVHYNCETKPNLKTIINAIVEKI